jgi:tRNA A-37 threonylcarbamoyl transferase component Bud32
MLYQVKFNSSIAKNVVKSFKELHARGICHGDVRVENILIRPNNSIVIIDFESSEVDADIDTLSAEMKQVKLMLTSLKKF